MTSPKSASDVAKKFYDDELEWIGFNDEIAKSIYDALAALISADRRERESESVIGYERGLLLLEERQVTARMENDVRKYGEFQCDYNTWLREIEERRKALMQPLPPLPGPADAGQEGK